LSFFIGRDSTEEARIEALLQLVCGAFDWVLGAGRRPLGQLQIGLTIL
jgi:hypothetical protein